MDAYQLAAAGCVWVLATDECIHLMLRVLSGLENYCTSLPAKDIGWVGVISAHGRRTGSMPGERPLPRCLLPICILNKALEIDLLVVPAQEACVSCWFCLRDSASWVVYAGLAEMGDDVRVMEDEEKMLSKRVQNASVIWIFHCQLTASGKLYLLHIFLDLTTTKSS